MPCGSGQKIESPFPNFVVSGLVYTLKNDWRCQRTLLHVVLYIYLYFCIYISIFIFLYLSIYMSLSIFTVLEIKYKNINISLFIHLKTILNILTLPVNINCTLFGKKVFKTKNFSENSKCSSQFSQISLMSYWLANRYLDSHTYFTVQSVNDVSVEEYKENSMSQIHGRSISVALSNNSEYCFLIRFHTQKLPWGLQRFYPWRPLPHQCEGQLGEKSRQHFTVVMKI